MQKMNRLKVLILAAHHSILIETLDELGLEYILHVNLPIDSLDSSIKSTIVGIVTSNACTLSAGVLSGFDSLEFVARLGSGLEIIDVEYCSRNAINCWSSPLGNANAVAEHALGMILSLQNNFRKAQSQLINHQFIRKDNTGHELSQIHIGIIGLGSNGTLLAQKMLMLGAKVSAVDIDNERSTILKHENFKFSSELKELFDCNYISLHVPYNSHTHHIINDEFVSKIRTPFYLINCARGGLVDTKVLANALQSGKILGAGIDVWEYEPISDYPEEYLEMVNSIILNENVIATPHIAGYTHEANYKMSLIISEKIREWYKKSF